MFTKQLQQYIDESCLPYITKKEKEKNVQVTPQKMSFRYQSHINTNIKKKKINTFKQKH